jgi:hypothetical protein
MEMLTLKLCIWSQWKEIQRQSVHCAGLLDVQGTSENVLSAEAAGSPGKLKVIHSVIA